MTNAFPTYFTTYVPCSGQFGLWIDDQFYHGASYVCKTFNNERLSSTADFICYGVEAWGFV